MIAGYLIWPGFFLTTFPAETFYFIHLHAPFRQPFITLADETPFPKTDICNLPDGFLQSFKKNDHSKSQHTGNCNQ